MKSDIKIPDYLTDEFSMYLENMSSLTDPENPELLVVYLTNLFEQLKKSPLLFEGMVDQLAMAITTKIRIDSKKLMLIGLDSEPTWTEVKAFVSVHADARESITEIMKNSERNLKLAVLLIHFYNSYDSTPLKIEQDEFEEVDDYLSEDFDENY